MSDMGRGAAGPPLRFQNSFSIALNPIPAGVLENQDMLGGGQLDPPPSKSHV